MFVLVVFGEIGGNVWPTETSKVFVLVVLLAEGKTQKRRLFLGCFEHESKECVVEIGSGGMQFGFGSSPEPSQLEIGLRKRGKGNHLRRG